MKCTTFKFDNNSNNNNTFLGKSPNYSEILDSIIATNIMDTNTYLKKTKEDSFIDAIIADSKKKNNCTISSLLKEDDYLTKAANYLAKYKKPNPKFNFTTGKIYKLIDGTPIAFYDDEIQIGLDLYSYSDFNNIIFLKKLPSATKKIIINLFFINN